MDKQTNILTNTQGTIPVNIRTIGAPEGIYILYLEDYVHTFIKKILSNSQQNVLPADKQRNGADQEYQIENPPQQEIALYGRSIEENGRYRLVISGAAVSDGSTDKIRQLNDTYFSSCSYIGNASVSLNKDSRLRLELTLRNTRVILDDFYIYYDQNEEMQNYLVEWNTTREADRSKVLLSPAGYDTHMRGSASDAAQLGRITQAYNREEAKVSFMWNVMNVLCLGFVVCVMAYGIVSMNNYSKMQDMQENIDYCMAFIEENASFLINTSNTDTEQSYPVSAMQQNAQDATPAVMEAEQPARETTDMQALAQPVIQDTAQLEEAQEAIQTVTQSEETPGTVQTVAQSEETPGTVQTVAQLEEAPESQLQQSGETLLSAEQNSLSGQEQASTPQYYIVRRGDTLRTICYDIYGDYSRVDEICRWNNIDDPDNILYGQKLLLP